LNVSDDVVELPLAQYDSSSGVEYILQRLDIGRTHTVEDTITVAASIYIR